MSETLRLIAKSMLDRGEQIEKIRRELRGTLLNEDFPTCSSVEDAIRAVSEPSQDDLRQTVKTFLHDIDTHEGDELLMTDYMWMQIAAMRKLLDDH